LLELRARGYEPARRELQIAARTRTELRIDLDALSRQKGISPVFFWVGAGVSLAAAGVGAIFGTMALSARSDVDARLADPLRRWEVSEADRSEIDDLALAADLLFGTAALFAVGTGILFFMTDWGDGDEERATPSVALSRDGASVLVRGAFE